MYDTEDPDEVSAARDAFEAAGIPYRTGLLASEPPRVLFSVPRRRLGEARSVLAARTDLRTAAPFPWHPLRWIAALTLVHLALLGVSAATGGALLQYGGLRAGGTALQPWRLITSLVLHADLRHVFWNTVSLFAFSVPLMTELGYARTGLLYLLSGLGGGITAVSLAEAGTTIVGSSGAIAGLFGAWVVLRLVRSPQADLQSRARIRAIGIGLLVLPSLLSPMSGGKPVSVGSHLGGLLTGMVIGALLGARLLDRK